jgi:hypothetical protein
MNVDEYANLLDRPYPDRHVKQQSRKNFVNVVALGISFMILFTVRDIILNFISYRFNLILLLLFLLY